MPDDDKPARKKAPRRIGPILRTQYELDKKTAGWLQAAATNYSVVPDELLWRLVRYGLKPYVLHGRLPKEILESLPARPETAQQPGDTGDK